MIRDLRNACVLSGIIPNHRWFHGKKEVSLLFTQKKRDYQSCMLKTNHKLSLWPQQRKHVSRLQNCFAATQHHPTLVFRRGFVISQIYSSSLALFLFLLLLFLVDSINRKSYLDYAVVRDHDRAGCSTCSSYFHEALPRTFSQPAVHSIWSITQPTLSNSFFFVWQCTQTKPDPAQTHFSDTNSLSIFGLGLCMSSFLVRLASSQQQQSSSIPQKISIKHWFRPCCCCQCVRIMWMCVRMSASVFVFVRVSACT